MIYENKNGLYIPIKKIYGETNGVKRVINKKYENIKSIANEVFFYSESYDLLKGTSNKSLNYSKNLEN